MKIVIIVGSFKNGGAERMSINTGEELRRLGHNVRYIVQRPIFEIPNSIPNDRITVLRKENKQDYWYKITRLFGGTFVATRKINPDVVIAFTRFSSFVANFTFCRKIIGRFDAYPFRMSKQQQFYARNILNSPFVKKIVVPSSGMIEALKSHSPEKAHKYYLLANSINMEEILSKSKEFVVNYDFKYITAMGRISEQKNFELLIEAYSRSMIKNKYKLIIIGDGPHKTHLIKLAKELKVSDQVIFPGRLSNPFPIIKGSEFFVNPSKFESFGNVILEALLLSKPVIATNCDYGPSDMIKTGINGDLIESNSLRELIEKLNEWSENSALIKSYSSNAYNSAKKFNLNEIGKQWELLLNQVVNNKQNN